MCIRDRYMGKCKKIMSFSHLYVKTEGDYASQELESVRVKKDEYTPITNRGCLEVNQELYSPGQPIFSRLLYGRESANSTLKQLNCPSKGTEQSKGMEEVRFEPMANSIAKRAFYRLLPSLEPQKATKDRNEKRKIMPRYSTLPQKRDLLKVSIVQNKQQGVQDFSSHPNNFLSQLIHPEPRSLPILRVERGFKEPKLAMRKLRPLRRGPSPFREPFSGSLHVRRNPFFDFKTILDRC
eukprot:TRINITY_DN15948_c0_g1_i2.p1 TRINITY_DN15948_c0_g1~~TRINITY_DN15948_c0_g1_i2.p1  ORF type:complete len:257 (+),score=26.46 TRINITY_DN15948_c0_g1_i2:60-773(+)